MFTRSAALLALGLIVIGLPLMAMWMRFLLARITTTQTMATNNRWRGR